MTTPDTKAIREKAKMWHLPAGIADDILSLCDALDDLRAENDRLAKVRDSLSDVEQLHREQAHIQFHISNKAGAERDEARASMAEAMTPAQARALAQGIIAAAKKAEGKQ